MRERDGRAFSTLFFRAHQHKLAGAVVSLVAIDLAHARVVPHPSLGIHNAGQMELRQDIQDARTAQAYRWCATNGLILDLAIGQPQTLNGALGRAHAMLDMSSFKSRTGGARRADHGTVACQANFGVGADVDGQHHAFRLSYSCRQ